MRSTSQIVGLGLLIFTVGFTNLSRVYANLGNVSLNKSSSLIYSNSNRPRNAGISQLTRAVTLSPSSLHFQDRLGWAYAVNQQRTEAIAAWANSDRYQNTFHLGLLAAHNGQLEEAIAWFTSASSYSGSGDAFYEIAELYESIQQFESAASYYEEAFNQESLTIGRSFARVQMGKAMLLTNNPDFDQAIAQFDKALAEDDFDDESQRIQAHFFRGRAFYRLGRLAEAFDDFSTTNEHWKDHYWTTAYLGALAWELNGDAATARRLLQQAIAINPKPSFAPNRLNQIFSPDQN